MSGNEDGTVPYSRSSLRKLEACCCGRRTDTMSIFDHATDMLKELFEYNKENFMEDREQRQIMEYELTSFRIEQVRMWREDIREIAELTPEKLEIYLLVIALELGFCVMALCKGRVPPGAPPWLVACHTIAVIAAFVYLLLAFWFAMHAFVSAQAYKVRILTQLVRLPVPTWRQMEASRTYSSAFEKLGYRQMLRLPFLNPQARVARHRCCAEEADDNSPRRAAAASSTMLNEDRQNKESLAADPWGLERRGDGIPELAPDVNVQAERQRHIWLIREASKFYQTYDAFSRVSMSAGTCSLATFMCYYCLSYVLTENAAPAAAWGGMIVFSGSAVVIIVNDMQLKRGDFCMLLILKLLPPALSAVVTFRSSKSAGDPGDWEYLMPVALLAHGLSELYYLALFRVREVQTGALLPLAFRGLLFLDPFAWAKHTGTWHKRLRQSLMQQGKLPQWATSSFALGNRSSISSRNLLQRSMSLGRGEFGLFSRSRMLSGFGSNASLNSDDSVRRASTLPTMECVETSGPIRPEDVAHNGHDEEAPSQAPESISFRPGTFTASDCEPVERVQFSTGTDIHGEFPGLVPWKVFFSNTMVLTIMWWFAAAVALVNARKGAAVFVSPNYGLEDGVVAPMADIRIAGGREMHFGMRFSTKWGNSSVMAAPHGLTCDPSGKVFATIGPTVAGQRGLLHGRLEGSTVRFAPSPPCRALNQQVQDVAFTECFDVETGNCSAHVLSRGGQLVTCPLSTESGHLAKDRHLSRSWLQDRGGRPPPDAAQGLLYREELSSISAVPCIASDRIPKKHGNNAAGSAECFVVGTTAKRMVQLEQRGVSGPFVPRRLLRLDSGEVPGSGSLALLKGRFVGMLIQGQGVLQMLDMEAGGRVAGTWRLPHLRTQQRRGGGGQWAGICGGGDSFYVLEDGDDPGIWRFPVPELGDGNAFRGSESSSSSSGSSSIITGNAPTT